MGTFLLTTFGVALTIGLGFLINHLTRPVPLPAVLAGSCDRTSAELALPGRTGQGRPDGDLVRRTSGPGSRRDLRRLELVVTTLTTDYHAAVATWCDPQLTGLETP